MYFMYQPILANIPISNTFKITVLPIYLNYPVPFSVIFKKFITKDCLVTKTAEKPKSRVIVWEFPL